MRNVLFFMVFVGALSVQGCAHFAETAAVEEFSKPSPTDLCRVENIRAIRGEGIILSGFYKYHGESLRHVTAYKDFGKGLERVDLTCPECEPDGPPILIVHVKDYHITGVEEPIYEISNPVKLAYIRKALEIEGRRAAVDYSKNISR